jgi:hypothetical protein
LLTDQPTWKDVFQFRRLDAAQQRTTLKVMGTTVEFLQESASAIENGKEEAMDGPTALRTVAAMLNRGIIMLEDVTDIEDDDTLSPSDAAEVARSVVVARSFHEAGITEGFERVLATAQAMTRERLIAWLKQELDRRGPEG